MTETPSDMRPGTWQVPESPLLIEYSPAMLDEIRLVAVDAFFSLPRGGAEIGGVLFGSHAEDCVRITAFRPMECEHAMGPTFVLSEKDRMRLRTQLEESRHDPLLKGLEIVGWYHSHTRSDIFLSQLDLEIYNEFFPEPWQVALVMRPAGMKPSRAGFFFREGDGEVHSTASYSEFIVASGSAGARGGNGGAALAEPAACTTAQKPIPDSPAGPAAAEQLSAETQPAALQRIETVVARRNVDVGPPIEMRPTEFVPPAFMMAAEPKRSRAWIFLAAFLIGGVGAAAWFTSGYWMKALSSKTAYLHLQTLDRDGQLHIQWDRAFLASADVQGGSLEIVDGAYATTIPLDAARLRAGSFDYVRRTEIVEAHLTVRTGRGNPLEEFTAFYGKPGKSAGPTDRAPEKRTAELAAEAERARGDLKKEELRSLELERRLNKVREQMRRDEERKRVENQMPAANARPDDSQPPATPATPPARTANDVNLAPVNAAPQVKPQGSAQSVVSQAIKPPAPPPDKPPVTAERPVALPPKQQQERPTATPPQPTLPSLSGRWVYSRASKSGSAFPPESVTLMLAEAHNQVSGNFTGRYKVPKNGKMNPRVSFSFAGPLHAGSSKFGFTSADGLKGEIELIRLPGKQDAIEVVWYSERDKLTFDDIFFRMP